MSKKTLYILLIVDLLIIVCALYVIFSQLNSKKSFQMFSSPSFRAAQKKLSFAVKPEKTTVSVQTPDVLEGRRILFTYRNSKPNVVTIVGEFNDWKPARMAKGKNHVWSITLKLKPGNYLYGYMVDGRFIHDPNSLKTREGVDGKKCSFLTVKEINKGIK